MKSFIKDMKTSVVFFLVAIVAFAAAMSFEITVVKDQEKQFIKQIEEALANIPEGNKEELLKFLESIPQDLQDRLPFIELRDLKEIETRLKFQPLINHHATATFTNPQEIQRLQDAFPLE